MYLYMWSPDTVAFCVHLAVELTVRCGDGCKKDVGILHLAARLLAARLRSNARPATQRKEVDEKLFETIDAELRRAYAVDGEGRRIASGDADMLDVESALRAEDSDFRAKHGRQTIPNQGSRALIF